MAEKNDWRLSRGQEEYLHGQKCKHMKYPIYADDLGQHAHCELCWATISPYGDDEHEGYQTTDGLFWICEACFSDFAQMLCLEDIGKQREASSVLTDSK